MLEKLENLEEYYLFLEKKLSDVEVIKNRQEWQKYTREHAALSETVETYRRLKKVQNDSIKPGCSRRTGLKRCFILKRNAALNVKK